MAIDIAGQQILAQPVSGFLQGRAIRRAEQEGTARMKALEMAEGRQQQRAQQEQVRFDESQKMRNTQVLYRALSQIHSSDDPVATANTLARSPEITEIFSRLGKDPAEGFRGKSADEIRQAASEGMQQLEPFITPTKPEAFTLSKGEQRFVGDKMVAENTAPDEDQWTNPEPVMIGGRKVMAQVNKRTGDPRIVPGASPIEPAGGEKDKSFERANTLRDEFVNQSKDFTSVEASYSTIQALGKQPSAAGDIGLLTSYMRMVDPGSTVREGEFATAENAGGVPDRVKSRYNNLLRGERLSDEQRKDFISQAKNMYDARKGEHKKLRTRYKSLAERAQIDPLDVIGADAEESISISSDEEYEALPSGAIFTAPDGTQRRKP